MIEMPPAMAMPVPRWLMRCEKKQKRRMARKARA